jgi:hypothetical protein
MLSALTLAVALQGWLAADEVEDKINKVFAVQPGGKLKMKVDRGNIEIKGGSGDSVDVTITRVAKAGSKEKAESILRDHVVELKQDGNEVSVVVKEAKRVSSGWWSGGNNLRVRYVVAVPRAFNVDAHTAGGSVEVAGLQGTVLAGTSGGGLKFADVEGKLSGHTSGGSISVTGVKGPVDIDTSGGGISLKDVTGDVEARTSGGSIEAKHVVGKLDARTSGGGIELSAITGEVDARTSGGSVSAAFSEGVTKPVKLETSGGSISVELPGDAAVDVDAHTSAGRVTCDLPVTVQGEQKGGVLRGKINGGGPLLELETSAGGIRIKKK